MGKMKSAAIFSKSNLYLALNKCWPAKEVLTLTCTSLPSSLTSHSSPGCEGQHYSLSAGWSHRVAEQLLFQCSPIVSPITFPWIGWPQFLHVSLLDWPPTP